MMQLNGFELDPPAHLEPVLSSYDELYEDTVRPLEARLHGRLSDSRRALDDHGRRHPEIWEARRAISRESARRGLLCPHLPERLGGSGHGREDTFHIEERVYRRGIGLNPAMLAWTDGATPRLLFAAPDQHERYVAPLVAGEATSLHGVTEPHAGSNFFDFRTRAERRDGRWVLNGLKSFITNAFEADIAHVLAVTDPAQGTRSFTYFQFETAEFEGRGFETGRLQQTMWDDGITGEILLEGLELGDEHILGERGQGFKIAMTSINWTRLRRGGMCSGWGAYLLDRTLDRVRERKVAGRPLGARQGVQWMIADMYVDWLAARSLSLECARAIDQPGPWYEARTPEDIRHVSAVKLANDEAFYRVADRAVQLFGGAGMMKDNPINELFLIARNLRVPGGSDEVQRTTIAETLGLRFDGRAAG